MNKAQLTAAHRALSERTINGKSLSFADSARMVEEEFDQSGLGDLLEKTDDPEPLSVYLDDPQADNWVWKYQEDVDEWHFFADDYEPVVSVKVMRWDGAPLPVFLRGTTMPKGVREVIMRAGLMLFEKSDAGMSSVAMDKAVVMKMADEVLATIEWMKAR